MIENILSRLAKVKRTGTGSYLACCPAHDDKSPSMTLREAEDGRILIHCFSGCEPLDILGAIGLELTDLFPERQADALRIRKPWNANDILKALSYEITIIGVCASDLMKGKKLSKEDYNRMLTAITRVQAAIGEANAE